ncbi:MAG: F0F1 ATP synthase subunit delta, partial [Microcella sp.]|nr:F0F1 ATP synthase subunit delta [Microcella sp.]
SSPQLLSALSNPSANAAGTAALVDTVFSELGASARDLLQTMVASRWSSGDDLLAGIEEIGIRAIAASAPAEGVIEAELFEFGRAVTSHPELELAIGSKRGTAASKLALVTDLLGVRASAQSRAIAGHLVQQPRGRRIGELVRTAAATAADTAGKGIATVTVAAPLSAAQLTGVAATIAARYGRGHVINQIIDPALVGGVRVQVGDEVTDGSIAARLTDLKLQLAG